jgi:hypothetical protein
VAPTVVAPGAVTPVVTTPATTAPASTAAATSAGASKSAAAVGATITTLPNNSVSLVIEGVQHFQFGTAVYRPIVQGSAVVYQQVR